MLSCSWALRSRRFGELPPTAAAGFPPPGPHRGSLTADRAYSISKFRPSPNFLTLYLHILQITDEKHLVPYIHTFSYYDLETVSQWGVRSGEPKTPENFFKSFFSQKIRRGVMESSEASFYPRERRKPYARSHLLLYI